MFRAVCRLLLAAAMASAAAGRASAADPEPALDPERGLPLLRTFSPRAYRGHNQIWASAESPGGTLLFSHLNAIAEFDGLNWREIAVPGASFIRGMATDAAGTIWIAGVNELGRLTPGADGRLIFESLRARVPKEAGELGAFWKVHALPDGVWFQSNAALLRWRNEKFDVWPMGEKQTVLAFPLGEKLMVARTSGWFAPVEGGGWEQLGEPALAKVLPRFLFPAPQGGWLVGTGAAGLQHFDGTRLTPLETEADEWLKTKKLYGGRPLPDGGFILFSLQGGALVLRRDLRCVAVLDESAGLPSNTAISATIDRYGAAWIGTDRGLARVDLGSPITWLGAPHGLGRNGSETLQRNAGRLLLGGDRGMLTLDPPAGPLARPQWRPTLEGPDRFNVFLPQPDGMLAGGVTGLFWLRDGKTITIASGTGPVSGVREIQPSRGHPGLFFVTHLNGIAWLRRTGETWEVGTNWTELSGELRTPIEDETGALWLTTLNNGLLRLRVPADPRERLVFDRFGEAQGLPVQRERLWMSDVGGGPLFHFRGGFFRFDNATQRFQRETRYGAPFADGSLSVRVMKEDAHGGLWLAAEPDATAQLRLFYARGGRIEQLALPDAEEIGSLNHLGCEERDGREVLWVGGQHLLLRVDLTAWRTRPQRPVGTTLLRQAIAGTQPLDPTRGETAAIAARHNTLRFVFGTPGLAGEPNVLHATQLHGFSEGRESVSSANERVFTNLPAGDYTFEVRGRSADARWSEPARFHFRVLAPWWNTPWAWTGYTLCLGVGVYGIVRRRTRGLERERVRLEAVVASRTTELAEKNRELERLNLLEQDEKLAARLAEEKARLELLRYQLNPHFLFNSLNSIRALVYAQPDAAGEMVTRLAEFCRWTLTRGADETTTVADEAEMVRTYLDIEKVRWQEALVTTLAIDEAARPERLPQFLLLPLIENAIKYGGRTSPRTLEVRVTIRAVGEALLCEVANTGTWVETNGAPSPTSTHIGLENLRQRLARHYGTDWKFEILRDAGWVRVQLRLRRGLPLEPKRPSSRDPFTTP